jgi:hypothetical protein
MRRLGARIYISAMALFLCSLLGRFIASREPAPYKAAS